MLVAVEGAFAYGFTGGLDEAAAVAPDLAYGLTGMEGLAVAVAGAGAAADTPEPGGGLFRPAQANCGTGDAFASNFFRASSRVGISKGMAESGNDGKTEGWGMLMGSGGMDGWMGKTGPVCTVKPLPPASQSNNTTQNTCSISILHVALLLIYYNTYTRIVANDSCTIEEARGSYDSRSICLCHADSFWPFAPTREVATTIMS